MSWLKGYLQTDTGRSIGKNEGELIYFNPANGFLIVQDGSAPYITTLSSMPQYKLIPYDPAFIESVIAKDRVPEVKELVKEVLVENKDNKNWFKKK